MRLFVYGTLKDGFSNSNFLKECEFHSTSYTVEKYDMVSCGMFPAVKESGDIGVIEGEVYIIDKLILDKLDVLESNGFLYHRKLIEIANQEDLVWMYFIINEIAAGFSIDNIHVEDGIMTWI